ncbi:uncharacterized protein LOC126680291 [Mercurialis annua]|uniref:uncharacterized protein LOC126665382 n=1 Tax=Mercurialis annua TaxID=3986 RepID=UPI00215F25C2|nr:uncharacterized protein LOC126665382 [Mercurialis annua]XP_050231330.1 uncharacterized protein LOC126680272 [Mercurialis annua]XP_050231342.1 uncharacterized protein LOC126680282 [Mercurialis annua]XP_050231351.1 uncharacterized protein LOC126680291 [Mercurialis annua]
MAEETFDGVIPVTENSNCKCGKKAKLLVSWSEKNPGRRFFRCEGKQCSYFMWYDEEYAHHIKTMLNHLKRQESVLTKETEYLRGEVFRLKYLMDHASTLDAIDMEKKLKELKDDKGSLEGKVNDLNMELKMELNKKLVEMQQYEKEIKDVKKHKEFCNYIAIVVIVLLISYVIMN